MQIGRIWWGRIANEALDKVAVLVVVRDGLGVYSARA